jgi:hypothetical protein
MNLKQLHKNGNPSAMPANKIR